ncbi:MAG: CRISPR-associated endonuclease Cas1 [Cyanobacterium sp. T60_A2020_053]|nr:CRISPR-associated endonuclease Cas1 [Cyanobacterium sp. T60_A2020_053]
MKTVYISQQGCYLCLDQEQILVKKNKQVINEIQLPLVEQILIFGKSQLTTQLIRKCLWQNIPILYLSRMGYCYGRIISIERGYRQLSRYQQQIEFYEKLTTAKIIISAKINNSKIIIQRQQRRKSNLELQQVIDSLSYLQNQAEKADSIERLFGYEGAGASTYFSAFGQCLSNPDLVFYSRSRRPPGNEINALLSFGYQVLWNHLLSLIELQGLDPYYGCLHQNNERHASLASDLMEEFRAGIVDSLVLYLVNKNIIKAREDFSFRDGGCYLNDNGRRKYLQAFVTRMEEIITNDLGEKQPRWDLLMQQVKKIKQFFYNPAMGYQPYLLR